MGDTVAGSIKDDNANRAQQSFAVLQLGILHMYTAMLDAT